MTENKFDMIERKYKLNTQRTGRTDQKSLEYERETEKHIEEELNKMFYDAREEVARRLYQRVKVYNDIQMRDPLTPKQKKQFLEEDFYLIGYLERLTDQELPE